MPQSLAVSSNPAGSNLKAAFALSDKLAKEGKAPWLPGAWKSVEWPAIPEEEIRRARQELPALFKNLL